MTIENIKLGLINTKLYRNQILNIQGIISFLLALITGKAIGWFAVSIGKITSFSAWTLVMGIFICCNTLKMNFKDTLKTISVLRDITILNVNENILHILLVT